jgi:hypothetical protein
MKNWTGVCFALSLSVLYMQMMENSVYEKVAEYFMLMGRTELLTCSATQTSFTRIRDQALQVSATCPLSTCQVPHLCSAVSAPVPVACCS